MILEAAYKCLEKSYLKMPTHFSVSHIWSHWNTQKIILEAV